ncbi:hypothetical protein ACCO45_008820 [Purpureocillium lilacinum]|uniref:Uncharacterized protein n=1 Tax=Purpureocillium lilacinum TaxID=33203 RepID=A0ACC4DJE1_PURLI
MGLVTCPPPFVHGVSWRSRYLDESRREQAAMVEIRGEGAYQLLALSVTDRDRCASRPSEPRCRTSAGWMRVGGGRRGRRGWITLQGRQATVGATGRRIPHGYGGGRRLLADACVVVVVVVATAVAADAISPAARRTTMTSNGRPTTPHGASLWVGSPTSS